VAEAFFGGGAGGKAEAGTVVGNGLRISARGQGRAFASFESFKRFFGPAGAGYHWHHIVEQRAVNVARVGQRAVQNTSNIVRVDVGTHREISRFYSSRQPFTGGQTFRQWLGEKSYAEQREWGIRILKKYGGGQ
jgi:hypothetical protein